MSAFQQGIPRREATLEASRLRLRPILMTSFAFILGVVPLVLAQGAGAEMRQALGIAVFGGMLGVTAFGIFLTPVFFYVLRWFSERWEPAQPPPPPLNPHHSMPPAMPPAMPHGGFFTLSMRTASIASSARMSYSRTIPQPPRQRPAPHESVRMP